MRQRTVFEKKITMLSVEPVIIRDGVPEVLENRVYPLKTSNQDIQDDIMIAYDLTPDVKIAISTGLVEKVYRMDNETFLKYATEVTPEELAERRKAADKEVK